MTNKINIDYNKQKEDLMSKFRKCVICGDPLLRYHSKYCSGECARIGENLRQKERKKNKITTIKENK